MGELITVEKIKPGILYLDNREPDHFPELFAELCPIPIQVVTLKTGDIAMDGICFERKTINDFVMSIIGKGEEHDGRIFTQSERMLKEFPRHYIFVTGTLKDYTGKIHKHCILGALARMLANGISVCFGIDTEEEFTYLVLKTLEKEGKLKMYSTKPKPKKPKEVTEKVEEEVFVGQVP